MNVLNHTLNMTGSGPRKNFESERILKKNQHQLFHRTDRLIASLICLQWPAAIFAALLLSPRTWDGAISHVHPHLLLAIYLGGLFSIPPVALAFFRPGEIYTRHIMAACQMLMSGLLIHISGGRLETHFHVFGSLAFLAFYLDWTVLLTATAVTLADHALMGYFAPAAIFGSSVASGERLLEHALWVLFFDAFLVTSCVQSLKALRSVARREADQEVLLYHAYHDALTGLGNRLQIQKTLNELRLDRRKDRELFALIAVDLDRFKEVNDTLGHEVGDKVLMQASQRLQEQIRKTDLLVRMGGDEFAIVLNDGVDLRLAEGVAGRILEGMKKPFLCDGHAVRLGVSLGICLREKECSADADLFQHADLALYKAKNNGRNNFVVFDEMMRAETLRLMSLENRLRTAVIEKTLQIYYQPIVRSNGTMLGFEALLRWTDHLHGSVSPGDFIPMAERTGLIVPLGKWVLQEACMQAALWLRSGKKLEKMSVNVSSLQLAHVEFIATVLSALKESGLPPEKLDLELTESTLIKNHGQTFKTLEFLRKFGVKLSIDDFGTGYSSLSYLRELPVHTLKIDRAFMQDIAESPEARLLVEGMVEMAHSLHLRVVGEGVETQEQMEILAQVGCDEIQGFLISKAVPPEEARQLLAWGAGEHTEHVSATLDLREAWAI